MLHLTPRHYHQMPWANGRGVTTELYRVDTSDGQMIWRLSMAMVVEDGPFSVFAGVDRNLTVVSGPGFDLVGPFGVLRAAALVPVAFAGDVATSAQGVAGPSADFNVMTDRAQYRQDVRVLPPGSFDLTGTPICLFLLEPGAIALGVTVVQAGRHDLFVLHSPARISSRAPLIAVELTAVGPTGPGA